MNVYILDWHLEPGEIAKVQQVRPFGAAVEYDEQPSPTTHFRVIHP